MTKRDDDWLEDATNPINVALLRMSAAQEPSSLQMVTGPGAPRKYDLWGQEVVVGRAVDTGIFINSNDLSRRHAAFRVTGPNQWTVVDLESRNGVYLNGVKVHSAVLHEGDNLQLGTVVFVFHEGRGAAASGGS